MTLTDVSVSAVIPSHNDKPTLARAIRSVSSQIPQPLEIIVVDNASTDGTGEMLENETFGPTPLRVLRLNVDRGPAYSLRTGFEAARAPGSLIAMPMIAGAQAGSGTFCRLLETTMSWQTICF